jgi:hypothetical protein
VRLLGKVKVDQQRPDEVELVVRKTLDRGLVQRTRW